jgi:hypothetical protein
MSGLNIEGEGIFLPCGRATIWYNKGTVRLRRNTAPTLSMVGVLGLIFPTDAFAYLDPGTGSMVVQTVIAVLAAAGYALRVYWRRVQQLFKRSSESERTPPSTERR